MLHVRKLEMWCTWFRGEELGNKGKGLEVTDLKRKAGILKGVGLRGDRIRKMKKIIGLDDLSG